MKKRSPRYDAYNTMKRQRRDDRMVERGVIYSPHKAVAKPAKPLAGNKRKRIVAEAAVMMKSWKTSVFEYEGPAVHGLRSGMCLDGVAWPIADLTARDVVDDVLNRMGAKRPTWEEGQREYLTPRENCHRCGVPLTDKDIERGTRFCSDVCAKAMLSDEDRRDDLRETAVGRQAERLVRGAQIARHCKRCGEMFIPTDLRGKQVYCSHRCADARERTVFEQICPWCGKQFQTTSFQGTYCQHRCARAAHANGLFYQPIILMNAALFDRLFVDKPTRNTSSTGTHLGFRVPPERYRGLPPFPLPITAERFDELLAA